MLYWVDCFFMGFICRFIFCLWEQLQLQFACWTCQLRRFACDGVSLHVDMKFESSYSGCSFKTESQWRHSGGMNERENNIFFIDFPHVWRARTRSILGWHSIPANEEQPNGRNSIYKVFNFNLLFFFSSLISSFHSQLQKVSCYMKIIAYSSKIKIICN